MKGDLAPETNNRAEYWDIPTPPDVNGCGECIGPLQSWVSSIIEIKVSSRHALCKPANQSTYHRLQKKYTSLYKILKKNVFFFEINIHLLLR